MLLASTMPMGRIRQASRAGLCSTGHVVVGSPPPSPVLRYLARGPTGVMWGSDCFFRPGDIGETQRDRETTKVLAKPTAVTSSAVMLRPRSGHVWPGVGLGSGLGLGLGLLRPWRCVAPGGV